MTMRLTKPQRELLDMIKGSGHANCVESYPPALALVKLGLAVWKKGRFGHGRLVLPSSEEPQRGDTASPLADREA